MIDNFDFRKFITENKLGPYSKINEDFSVLGRHPMGGEKAGLMVRGRSVEDNTKIGQMVQDGDLHGEWNAREGYWFFPEDGDMYDALEKALTDEFDERGIEASIEGIF